MQEFIADKELSDADHIPEAVSVDDVPHVQEDELSVDAVDAANDDEREEGKRKRTYEKGANLRFDGPVSGLCSLERGAAYVGLTKPHYEQLLVEVKCQVIKHVAIQKMKNRMALGGLTPRNGTR